MIAANCGSMSPPNVEASGAGTASAALPGYASLTTRYLCCTKPKSYALVDT